ncbi:MAG: UxaA family hydrolase [Pedobacter sp.]|uniref:UxaA family hydrolase n=1 Tax=Pedobacter sp. TaxID=1411316 RepID=UPI0033941847
MSKLIKLHLLDNVLIATEDIPSGEHLQFQGMEFYFAKPVAIGHKIAALYIEAGERVIKHGVTIGCATTMIQMGDHVHLHNITSDYLPKNTNK